MTSFSSDNENEFIVASIVARFKIKLLFFFLIFVIVKFCVGVCGEGIC